MRSDDPRLARLRALIGKLERLPASDQRERALSEARARVVDVETGEVPRVMRPQEEPEPEPEPQPRAASPLPPAGEPKPKRGRATARRERAQVLRRPPVEPAPPAAPASTGAPVDAGDDGQLGSEGLLWLEDQAIDDPGTDGGDRDRTPWRRGLRG